MCVFLALMAVQASLYTASGAVTVYERPGATAEEWAVLQDGDQVDVLVLSSNGWLGFDPGVAQAGNSGSFRYRWLPPDTTFMPDDSLETVWAPRPGITYVITFEEIPLFAEMDSTAAPLFVLPAGSAAEMLGVNQGWVYVDLWEGSVEEDIQGWVISDLISVKW